MDARIGDLRDEYETTGIDPDTLADDPTAQFEAWFDAAWKDGVYQANTMVLATATPDGRPSARAVLMKGIEPGAIVFYTNAESHKGRELAANPHAAATFLWLPVHRQVRFEGTVSEVEPELADEYFHSRPYGAQVASAASPQSREVPDRAALEAMVADVEAAHPDAPVPRPAQWTGFRLIADRVEFWQGRRFRLHDRIVYERQADGWRKFRLAP